MGIASVAEQWEGLVSGGMERRMCTYQAMNVTIIDDQM
jgi:hypothetical protein